MAEVVVKHGVKETKEALVGFTMLGLTIAKLAKDGVQLTDAMALAAKFQEEEFRKTVVTAIEGIEKVPMEIKDLELAEMLELAQVLPVILAEIIKFKQP